MNIYLKFFIRIYENIITIKYILSSPIGDWPSHYSIINIDYLNVRYGN